MPPKRVRGLLSWVMWLWVLNLTIEDQLLSYVQPLEEDMDGSPNMLQ